MTAWIPALNGGRVGRVISDEIGQTMTETVMIVGLMAAAIVTVFTVLFWPAVSASVSQLVEKIATAISGGGIS